jgi:NAD-dependent DNA ligase
VTDLELYCDLAWKILEAKCLYYVFDKPKLTDYEYDMMERQYDALAEKLNLPKTASDMVGFNPDRPSCKNVMLKVGYKFNNRLKKKRNDLIKDLKSIRF